MKRNHTERCNGWTKKGGVGTDWCSTASCSLEPSLEIGRGAPWSHGYSNSSASCSLEPSTELPRIPPWVAVHQSTLPEVDASSGCFATLAGGGTSARLRARRPRTPLSLGKDHEDVIEAQMRGVATGACISGAAAGVDSARQTQIPSQDSSPTVRVSTTPPSQSAQGQGTCALSCSVGLAASIQLGAGVEACTFTSQGCTSLGHGEPGAPAGHTAELEEACAAFAATSFKSRGRGRNRFLRRLGSLKAPIPNDLLAQCWEVREPVCLRTRLPRPTRRGCKDMHKLAAAAQIQPSENVVINRRRHLPLHRGQEPSEPSSPGRSAVRRAGQHATSRGPRNLEAMSQKLKKKMAAVMGSMRKKKFGFSADVNASSVDANLSATMDATEQHDHVRPANRLEEDEKVDLVGAFGRTNLWKFAVKLQIPLDILKSAVEIFKEHCEMPTKKHKPSKYSRDDIDILEDSYIDTDKFANILCQLVGVNDVVDLPEGLLQSCFQVADANRSRTVDFSEFAMWYSRFGFTEDILLTAEQKELRQIARQFDMRITDVEHYKKCFDEFDSDGSGQVDEDEFGTLLALLLKVPAHLELPKARVHQFWLETDIDGSGSIAFDEFLLFYAKYFESASRRGSIGDGSCPLTAFYSGMRPLKPHAET